MALDVEDTVGRGEDKVPSSLGNNRRNVPCPSQRTEDIHRSMRRTYSVQSHRRLLNFATAGLFLRQSPILETSAHLNRGFDDLCRFQAWQLQRLPIITKLSARCTTWASACNSPNVNMIDSAIALTTCPALQMQPFVTCYEDD